MPQRFTQNLSPVDPERIPAQVEVDTSVGDAFRSVGKLINTFTPDPSATGLAEYSAKVQDIVGQTAGYKEASDTLSRLLMDADPRDAATIKSLNDQMAALRRGEIQGRISVPRASLLINNLTKQYTIRFPQLAKEFATLRNSLTSNIKDVAGPGSDQEDPDVKAYREAAETAAQRGWSVQAVIAENRATAEAEAQKREFEVLTRAGTVSMANYSAYATSEAFAAYKRLLPEVQKALQNPNATGKQIAASIDEATAALVLQVRAKTAEIQATTGVLLPVEQVNQLIATVESPLKTLSAIAANIDNPKDRKAFLDNLNGIQNAQNVADLNAIFGTMAPLVNSDNMFQILDEIHKTSKQLQNRQRAELEALAASGDVKMAFMLNILDTPRYKETIARLVGMHDQGQPAPSTGVPIVDKAALQTSLNIITNPTTSPEKKATMLQGVVQDPNIFEAMDKRPDIAGSIRGNAAAIKGLQQTGMRLLEQAVTNASAAELDTIEFDATNTSTPFNSTRLDAALAPIPGEFGSFAMAGAAFANRGLGATVDTLNRQFRVLSQVMPIGEAAKYLYDQYISARDYKANTGTLAVQAMDDVARAKAAGVDVTDQAAIDKFMADEAAKEQAPPEEAAARVGNMDQLSAEAGVRADWTPPPRAKRLLDTFHELADEYQVPVAFAVELAKVESRFNQAAVSSKDARGVMQVTEIALKDLVRNGLATVQGEGDNAEYYVGGYPVTEEQGNLRAGFAYLRMMYDIFHDWRMALAAYNAGPGAVREAGGIPLFNDGKEETLNYVQKITKALGLPMPKVGAVITGKRDSDKKKVEPGIYLDEATGDYMRVDSEGNIALALSGAPDTNSGTVEGAFDAAFGD